MNNRQISSSKAVTVEPTTEPKPGFFERAASPIPEHRRKQMIVVFAIAFIMGIPVVVWFWYHAGWVYGVLLSCYLLSLLGSAAGLLFHAIWAPWLTILSLVGTTASFYLSPPWDTTPKEIRPLYEMDRYEGDGPCELEKREGWSAARYVCYLSVSPKQPMTPTAPSGNSAN